MHGHVPEAWRAFPLPTGSSSAVAGLAPSTSRWRGFAPGGRIVATFAALDRAAEAADRLGNLVQVGVSRAKPLPDGGVGWLPRIPSSSPGDPKAGAPSHDRPRVSLTEPGRRLAERLPFEHVHGSMRTVAGNGGRRATWRASFVFAATGAAVRIVAPLLADKHSDPAVVCVDDAGRFAIALCGGHHGGANELTRRVAELLGATPVITTATDATGLAALDQLPGFVASGDIAGVSAALLDGRSPIIDNPLDWPLPEGLAAGGTGPERILVTDTSIDRVSGRDDAGSAAVLLRPASLVVGVGSSTGAESAEVVALVATTLAEAGLSADSLQAVATIDRRRHHPAITGLGLPVTAFGAETLAAVAVPNPSDTRRAEPSAPPASARRLRSWLPGTVPPWWSRSERRRTPRWPLPDVAVLWDASSWWGWARAALPTGPRRPSRQFVEPTWSSATPPMSISARTCWHPITGSSVRSWGPSWSGRVRL